MKKTSIHYGLYSAMTICTLFLLSWFVFDNLSYSLQEIIGYASMVIALIFIFFGIKYYRDIQNNGIITFRKALVIGMLITIMAAFAFGLLDVIYISYLNPDFMTDYYTHHADQMRNTMSATEYAIAVEELNAQQKIFANPFMNFLIMFLTVTMIGFIISSISGILLQRKNHKQCNTK